MPLKKVMHRMAYDSMEEILSMFSYCQSAGYLPSAHITLLNRIMKVGSAGTAHKDIELSRHVINMLVKLGFMLLSHDLINKLNGKSPHPIMKIYIEYHLYNFIYHTKSFLDSLASTLNHTYRLGLSRGNIDLDKERFIEALESQCDKQLMILNEVKKERNWIRNVVKWRDTLIHRNVTVIVHYGDPDITLDYMIKMPPEPVELFNATEMNRLRTKYGLAMQEIQPFCGLWIKKSKSLLEKLGIDLLARFPDPEEGVSNQH